MCSMRQAGIYKTGLQIVYEAAFFGKPDYEKRKVSVLRAGACVNEREMHDLP